MTRRILLFLILAGLALTGLTVYAAVSERGVPTSPEMASFPSGAPASLDSALAEIEAGRPWHGARLLRHRLEAGGDDEPATRLLLARAEAGWANWGAVRSLLEDAPWLGDLEGGLGWVLLARAREAAGEWEAAEEAYRQALELPASGESQNVLRIRRVRSLAGAGRADAARAALDSLRDVSGSVAAWLGLEMAGMAADRGDPEEVRRLLDGIPAGPVRERGWTFLPRAQLVGGDSSAAAEAYRRAAGSREGAERARALVVAGELGLALGDTAAARRDLEGALAAAPRPGPGAEAAALLVELPGVERPVLLRAARALAAAGRPERALEAYERAGVEAAASEETRLAVARLRSRDGFTPEVSGTLESLSRSSDPEVAAPALELLADAHRAGGREEDADAVEERIVERFPGRAAAVRALFFRADRRHDRGDLEGAAEGYRRTAAYAPSADLAGLSRMRLGQLHLTREDPESAEAVFRAYVEAFPEGERWDQATFWRAHSLRLLGREAEADRLLERIRDRDFLSYYALLAGRILGEEFLPGLPAGPEPGDPPAWLREGLRELDLLTDAGLEAGAEARVEALRGRALSSGEAILLLSEELTARGHGLTGIGLGWELRRRGQPWSLRLLRAVFPLPYREMIRREAAEWGVDSTLVAAVARQESGFDPDIRSSANAVGLIQVLPETGRQLAAEVGPAPFRPDLLELPEVNLHLGTAYLLQVGERYGGELTLILSAYNAGPHRADVWREFAEAADPLRFTERIPFRETRDYVKQVSRNQVLYAALYGMGRPEGASPEAASGDGRDGAEPRSHPGG